jgi:Flp pilus assembly pilin Flp
MVEKKLRRKRSAVGQGLGEYALILALVAIAVIVIVGLLGQAVQRGYGVIGAVLGVKQETAGVLSFDPNWLPQCGRVVGQGTGFYTEILTPITDLSQITASTDTGFIFGLEPIAGGFKIYQKLTPGDTEELGLCPHGLVIQVSKTYSGPERGAIATYPVLVKNW